MVRLAPENLDRAIAELRDRHVEIGVGFEIPHGRGVEVANPGPQRIVLYERSRPGARRATRRTARLLSVGGSTVEPVASLARADDSVVDHADRDPRVTTKRSASSHGTVRYVLGLVRLVTARGLLYQSKRVTRTGSNSDRIARGRLSEWFETTGSSSR